MSTIQNPWPPIGQLFVEHGRLTHAQLEDALEAQQRTGNPLGEILIERGYISRIDLAGALSKQWSWEGDTVDAPAAPPAEPPSPEPAAAVEPEPAAAVEPEPVAAAEPEPVDDRDETRAAAVELEATFAQFSGGAAQPPAETPPAPMPAAIEVPTDVLAELAARVSELEQQERVIADLQARLRAALEQLAAGESRIREVETLVAGFAQACGKLAAQSDAQSREIEELRRATEEQAERLSSAARALLP